MISAGENADFLCVHLIDEPMLVVGPPGPAVRACYTPKWILLGFPYQPNQSESLSTIVCDPPGEIFEGCRIKFQASQ